MLGHNFSIIHNKSPATCDTNYCRKLNPIRMEISAIVLARRARIMILSSRGTLNNVTSHQAKVCNVISYAMEVTGERNLIQQQVTMEQ